jgi:alpha-glucosidase
MLRLYRDVLRLRRGLPALGRRSGTEVTWLELGATVVAFSRAPGFTCVLNAGQEPVGLPAGDVVLASNPDAVLTTPDAARMLTGDCAVWLVS